MVKKIHIYIYIDPFLISKLISKKTIEGDIMNLEIIAQLAVLALVVASGPLVIALLAAQRGNL